MGLFDFRDESDHASGTNGHATDPAPCDHQRWVRLHLGIQVGRDHHGHEGYALLNLEAMA